MLVMFHLPNSQSLKLVQEMYFHNIGNAFFAPLQILQDLILVNVLQ